MAIPLKKPQPEPKLFSGFTPKIFDPKEGSVTSENAYLLSTFPIEGVPSQSPIASSSRNTLKVFFGIEEDSSAFLQEMSKIKDVEAIDPGNVEERRKAILTNAVHVAKMTQTVVNIGYENIKNNKDPWHKLQSGLESQPLSERVWLPIPPDLLFLSGDRNKQLYNHNAFVNHLAKAVIAAIEHNAEIEFYFDVDGTIVDKTRRPHSTRVAQPLEQIHALNHTIKALYDLLGVKIKLNTNRTPRSIKITTCGLGLNTNRIESEHYDGIVEVGGFSPEDQYEISRQVDQSALSTAYREKRDDWTVIADQAVAAVDAMKYFDLKRLVKESVEKHGFIVGEPKNLNTFILDTKRKNGNVYGQWITKIFALKEQIVDRGEKVDYKDLETVVEDLSSKEKSDRYKDFKDVLVQHVKYASSIRENLEEEWSNAKNHLQTLEDKEAGKEEIQKAKIALNSASDKLFSLIEIIGHDSNNDYIEYTDVYGVEKRKCINYFKCLEDNPVLFLEKLKEAENLSGCVHIRNSRNVPDPKAINEVIQALKDTENESGARSYIRDLNYKIRRNDENMKVFVEKAKAVYEQEGKRGFLRWKILKHLEMHYTRDELSKNLTFDCNDEKKLEFNKTFLAKLENETSGMSINDYVKHLKEEFNKSTGMGKDIVKYIDSTFEDDFLAKLTSTNPFVREECFYADALFCVNYKLKYNGEEVRTPIFSFEDKRTSLRPWGQGYWELTICLPKGNAIPLPQERVKKKKIIFTFGDSKSDVSAHREALHSVITLNGVKIGGAAIQIYHNIGDTDYIKDTLEKRMQDVKKALKEQYDTFSEDYSKQGIFGLLKEGDVYKKVIGIEFDGIDEKGKKKYKPLMLDDKTYSEAEIKKEIWQFLQPRIYQFESPVEQIMNLAYAASWLTKTNPHFDWKEFERAAALSEKKNKTSEEEKLVNRYKVCIEELERSKYISDYVSDSSVYFEYSDPSTGEKYYRIAKDRSLATKDGKKFVGDEKTLTQRTISSEAVNGHFGVLVYKDTFDPLKGKYELFADPDFLVKNCITEEPALPSQPPPKGLFERKWLTGLLGFGNIEKGKKNLRSLITKLPNIFSSTLSVCGVLLSIGGIIRLASKLLGGHQESIYKFGYWMSQSVRAVSAGAGALRGVLNVNKYYSITIGELGNIFSALCLQNGPKHIGYAFFNLFTLTDRGMQNAQRQLSSNILTEEEIKADKPVKGILDPRPFQADVTRFNTEKIKLPISKAVEDVGLPQFVGNFVGSLASSVLTTMYMLKQTITNPKLIFQFKNRVSDKSGNSCFTIPSTGHLFSLAGVLGGISAIGAGFFGRMEKFGEVTESGFNKLGKWLMSGATFVQSIPIILNGLEIAANQNGLPRMTRGLDGKTIKYSPERAGYGQVFAGAMFGLLSWLPLEQDWAASLFDTFALGPYFGAPKMRMSVAEEDKMNSLDLAEQILFENDQFFLKKKNNGKHSHSTVTLQPELIRTTAAA